MKKLEHAKKRPSRSDVFGIKLPFDIKEWNINTLTLTEPQQLGLIHQIYANQNLLSEFQIDNDKMMSFLWTCNYYYTRNNAPFHNFKHAITVCHASFYFLTQIKELSNMVTSLQRLAFLTASLGHDLDHRGRNNVFENNSCSNIAIRYFYKSPLENHHAATLLKILKEDQNNIFSQIPSDKVKQVQEQITENILATDMKTHFPLVAKFKESVEAGKYSGAQDDVIEVTNIFIHCADLSGSCKEPKIAEQWSKLVNIEFIAQYDEEIKLNLPESAHFRNLREKQGLFNSEIGFINVILYPLYEVANLFASNSLDPIMQNIKQTRSIYEIRLQTEKAKVAN